MEMFSKLFRPKAVADVLFCLDHLDVTPLADTDCYGEIKNRARQAIMSKQETVRKAVTVDGQPPLHVALNLIVNLCGGDLASGNYHTYRGVLGMRGAARRTLFQRAQSMMVERGLIDQEDADEGLSFLVEQIREAG